MNEDRSGLDTVSGETTSFPVLPDIVMNLPISLEDKDTRMIDSKKESVPFLILYFNRINTVRFKCHGLFQETRLCLCWTLALQLSLVQIHDFRFQLLTAAQWQI